MKIAFENRSEKLLAIAIAVVVAFITLSLMQYSNNKLLRKQINVNNKEVKELQIVNDALTKQIEISELEKQAIEKQIDSVEKSETYFKNKYYATNEKLKIILGNYNGSSDATKNELFTTAVNN